MDDQLTEDTTVRVFPDTYEGVARTDERFAAIAEVFGGTTVDEQYEAAIAAWETPLEEGEIGAPNFDYMVQNAATMAAWVKDTSEAMGVPIHVITHVISVG